MEQMFFRLSGHRRSMALLYEENSNVREPIGEAWLTSVDCRCVTGPFSGRSLRESWSEMRTLWRGTRLKSKPDFPLLLKFIFPRDWLSIQVHPDDAYASVYEKTAGGRGKTQMLHVFSAQSAAHGLVS